MDIRFQLFHLYCVLVGKPGHRICRILFMNCGGWGEKAVGTGIMQFSNFDYVLIRGLKKIS